jgi:hypothetical protein
MSRKEEDYDRRYGEKANNRVISFRACRIIIRQLQMWLSVIKQILTLSSVVEPVPCAHEDMGSNHHPPNVDRLDVAVGLNPGLSEPGN